MSRQAWKTELASCITEPKALDLSPRRAQAMARVIQRYPMRVPPQLARLMDASDPLCPIARQVLPHPDELRSGGQADPLDEENFFIAPGVIRRFDDRLLVLISNTCPVLCRHCNRKRYWQRDGKPPALATPKDIAEALSKSTGRIKEVILSGGEPLLRSDADLNRLLMAARGHAGVELLRIHSRAPVSLPTRITPGLVQMLRRHRPLWFVTHFNHAKEIDPHATRALERLQTAGIPVLNQAVLLKGINDSLKALEDLGRALLTAGVKPHVLFQLDRAEGTLHFQVPLKKAVALVAKLRAKRSGLLTPHLLADMPGRGGKVPITPSAIEAFVEKGAWIKGSDGKRVFYRC